jgi:hypothetical protein
MSTESLVKGFPRLSLATSVIVFGGSLVGFSIISKLLTGSNQQEKALFRYNYLEKKTQEAAQDDRTYANVNLNTRSVLYK